jgi:hypothetical protein
MSHLSPFLMFILYHREGWFAKAKRRLIPRWVYFIPSILTTFSYLEPGLPAHALNLPKSRKAVKGYETLMKPFVSMSLRGDKKAHSRSWNGLFGSLPLVSPLPRHAY